MMLSYNGLDLQVIKTNFYKKEPIFDGHTYLYTRHTISVLAVYNPKMVGYFLPAGLGNVPQEAETFAPETDAVIRHHLLQPRKKLLYRFTNQAGELPFYDVISSPQGLAPNTVDGADLPIPNPHQLGGVKDHPADATEGPFPISCEVKEVRGSKTFLVSFTIRTDINDCEKYEGGPPTVLSHVWSQEEQLDQDFLSIRVTRGRIVFHAGRLRAAGSLQDNYRNAVAQPLIDGFKREHVEVKISEDGLQLQYVIVDKEQPICLNRRLQTAHVTRVEASLTRVYRNMGDEKRRVTLFERELNVLGGAGIVFGRAIGGLVRRLRGIRDAATGQNRDFGLVYLSQSIASLAMTMYDTLPTESFSCQVKVWGDRASYKRDLYQTAISIALAAMPPFNGGSLDITATWDLTGKSVQLNVERMLPKLSVRPPSLTSVFGLPNSIDPVAIVTNTEGLVRGAFNWLRGLLSPRAIPDIWGKGTFDIGVPLDNVGVTAPGAMLTNNFLEPQPSPMNGLRFRLERLIATAVQGDCKINITPTIAPRSNDNLTQ